MTVAPPPDTPADDQAAYDALADAVSDELVAAGLPVLPREYRREGTSASGVSIYVDDGVWVGWHISGALRDASSKAFRTGAWRPDGSEIHPAMRHSSTVQCALNDAMAAILTALGYHVRMDANDMDPGHFLVSQRQPGPTWREPVIPPLAGASGYSPGVRVRLLDGEYAGSVTTVVSSCWDAWPEHGPPVRYHVEHPHGTGELVVPAAAVTLADS
jgi:hypothetical protein